MRYASVTKRLAGLGGAKWDLHARAREMSAEGFDVIELTIGEPDCAPPPELVEDVCQALRNGRSRYSTGAGEPGLRAALARRYTQRAGRRIGEEQVLCFPGTQTALHAVMCAVAETGTEVLVGDPMYTTYEGVIAATGARMIPVPLRPVNGFLLDAREVGARITPRSRAILLNTPHNPTGMVLDRRSLEEIATLAIRHDLWIICDEVYEELIFSGRFCSPLELVPIMERTVVVSSISKSHAAPGLRSGWCIGPAEFCARLLPLSETMLFGNQPFIADATRAAISAPSPVARPMAERFAARAAHLVRRLHAETPYHVQMPQAGMFALVDIGASGMNGADYAADLLETALVAVMPGAAFGRTLDRWVRVALSVDDARLDLAIDRIAAHAGSGSD
ncbi:pyridoxal phosphate-dependent aminotransferase [Profundibacterium mesophilum]|uniref:aspartate transaminase n=1 Tax=Profundibacterium mesophilum KAUST100406-0324 TaxID=1037889 RepID=A0A921NT14_9RHOB|nr:pyridoxal phosphate-dependent aminotransferase [Profundibacterium mesophilum]KAF0676039.1 Arginine--pyruvate transaminase AruH [Profundibacterium mesophilum KAUST100406-0324]